jgi:hypothetical protein
MSSVDAHPLLLYIEDLYKVFGDSPKQIKPDEKARDRVTCGDPAVHACDNQSLFQWRVRGNDVRFPRSPHYSSACFPLSEWRGGGEAGFLSLTKKETQAWVK